MTIELGRIHDVRIFNLGGHLDVDAATGSTVLTMEDSLDFNAYGGTISLGGVQYGYSSTDYDLEQLTLTTGLTADAVAGDRVDVWPLSTEKVASVVLNDEDEAVSVRIPHALADKILEGVRDPDARESVEISYQGTEFVLRDVLGKLPAIDTDYVDPTSLPVSLIVVQHGDDGTVPRPAAAVVYWIGAATPANALPYDLWYDATI